MSPRSRLAFLTASPAVLLALLSFRQQPTAAAAFQCGTDWDCELNGVCHPDGACVCDPGWEGADCGKLRLVPGGSIAYGCWPSRTQLDCDVTSWGGGPPVQDAETGKWVLFVSEMAGHCGLKPWNYMSQIVRTVGDAPWGPFVRDKVVVPRQAHNAYYAYDNSSKMHLIFHIQPGAPPSKFLDGCTNGTTPFKRGRGGGTAALAALGDAPGGDAGSDSPRLHAATSLDGPFTEVVVKGVPAVPAGGAAFRGAANVAPFIFENGTVLALYKVGQNCSDCGEGRGTFSIWAMRAPRFDGPYTVFSTRA